MSVGVIFVHLYFQAHCCEALVEGKQQLWSFDLCFLFLQAEVEETLKRIQSQKGVQGIIVVNSEGIVSLFSEIVAYTTRAF